MKKTVIVLNGPPRAGKDTAAAFIEEQFGAAHLKFSITLKEETHRRHGLAPLPHDAFERVKDDPLPEFGGKSPRQAYIQTGRDMRAVDGEDVFGRLLSKELEKHPANVIVVSDLASAAELRPLIENKSLDVTLLRVHRDGHDFSNDSRDYVYIDGVRSVDVYNAGDIDGYQGAILSAVRHETPALGHTAKALSARSRDLSLSR